MLFATLKPIGKIIDFSNRLRLKRKRGVRLSAQTLLDVPHRGTATEATAENGSGRSQLETFPPPGRAHPQWSPLTLFPLPFLMVRVFFDSLNILVEQCKSL